MFRIILCTALLATVVCAPAKAQSAPAAQAHSVEPKAQQLIEGMTTAYKGLKFYSGTMEHQMTQTRGANLLHWQAIMAFEQPNRVSVGFTNLMLGGSDTVFSFFDGKSLTKTTADSRMQHLKRPAPEGEGQILQVLHQTIDGFGAGFSQLLAGNDIFGVHGTLKSLSVTEPDMADGVPVETIVADFEGRFNERDVKTTITCVIGQRDSLLRRFVHAQTVEGQSTITTIETHSGVRSNYDLKPLTSVTSLK